MNFYRILVQLQIFLLALRVHVLLVQIIKNEVQLILSQ